MPNNSTPAGVATGVKTQTPAGVRASLATPARESLTPAAGVRASLENTRAGAGAIPKGIDTPTPATRGMKAGGQKTPPAFHPPRVAIPLKKNQPKKDTRERL